MAAAKARALAYFFAVLGLDTAIDAHAATNIVMTGEVQEFTILDRNDHWSRGTMVVNGQRITIPRNFLIDLPANRLSLKQVYDDAPALCQPLNQTGLALADSCNALRKGAIATVLANRTHAGDVIAGEIMLEKEPSAVAGVITYINYTDGYFRVNGIPNDPATGTMIRINDPEGRHTLQQGLGCAGGPNCSADIRYGLDTDNYTNTFSTGYPLCIPSTVTGGNRIVGSNSQGQGDPLCPHENRGSGPVADSFRFAPVQPGDSLVADGNFEIINGVQFLSAHTINVHTALTTTPGQPDYIIFAEVEWDAPGFANERTRGLYIGFSTLGESQLDIFSLKVNPNTNEDMEFPLASTVGNPDTVNQGIPPNAFGIWKINYDVDFLQGVDDRRSPCVNLANAGFTPSTGGCAGGPTLDVAQNFAILTPITREIIARSRNKVDNAIGDSQDIRGNPTPNGEYLTPVGVGHPEFGEIDLGRLQTAHIFEGEPWNLDRRLGPGGCNGPCEATPQPLDPFPFSGLDPRTQAAVPAGQADRTISFFTAPLGPPTLIASFPPLDPPSQGIAPIGSVTPVCPPEAPVGNLGPIAANDMASTSSSATVIIDVVANDTDDRAVEAASVGIVSSPINGIANPRGDGKIEYAPNFGFSGTDSFTYQVRDAYGAASNVATVTVEVVAPVGNVAPVANNDSATANVGGSVTINLIGNDTDTESLEIHPGSIQVVTKPSAGRVNVRKDGTAIYKPNLNFAGRDLFSYTIRDIFGAVSNAATVSIRILPPEDNLAPLASNDLAVTNPGVPITIDLIGNDSDPDGSVNPSTIVITVSPLKGTVVAQSDGTALYTPNADFIGVDSFRYRVRDNFGTASNTAVVTVNVEPFGNLRPEASDDSATTTEGTPVAISVLENDADRDGTLDVAGIMIVNQPVNGSAKAQANGTILFRPAQGFSGTTTFTYRVRDNVGSLSNLATVTVNVTQANESLEIVRAEYRVFKQEWRIEGKSSVVGPGNEITIYIGSAIGGNVLGTAQVDGSGSWSFRERDSRTAQADRVSIQSSSGAKLEDIAVTIKN